MRRSICYCDPSYAIAGERKTWRFIYTPAADLPKGTLLKFELNSDGRPNDWELPVISKSAKSNIIWADLPNGKSIKAQKINNAPSSCLFSLPSELKAGQNLLICLGSPLKDQDKNGNMSQTYTHRKRSFFLYIDPKGKGDFKEHEVFQIDVKGNSLHILNIITPSFVARNKRFDIIVRFEDRYGNLTNNAPEDTLIELSYEHLRENLLWKLFVPETGFITLPNLYFNEPGIYKIQLKNLKTNQVYYSCPIKCFPESDLNLFWGVFHGEFEKIDASTHTENYLRYARDELAYQFIASSCFDSVEETSNDHWKLLVQEISEFNEDERFSVFLGFNWVGIPKEEGLRQFIYLKDNKSIMRKKELKTNSLKKIYKTHNPKDLISIPSFTMGSGFSFDFSDYNPDFERVVEIYNAWGSSECSSKEDNIRPIDGGKNGIKEDKDGSIRKALENNCRFGFIAGGFDDRGIYSKYYDSNQIQYSPGLTAIMAKDLSREDLFDALHKRLCYATTGEKILLSFFIAEKPMGSELNTESKPGLLYNRYISGFVVGTDKLKKIDVIRNSKILTSFYPDATEYEIQFDDIDLLDKVSLPIKDSINRFSYYYLRIEQIDDHIAWSSPIWIDWIKDNKQPKVMKKNKKK